MNFDPTESSYGPEAKKTDAPEWRTQEFRQRKAIRRRPVIGNVRLLEIDKHESHLH